jgi:hypothetical protein
VAAPGAMPIKFRSTYVDGIYEPPRTTKTLVMHAIPEPKLFTAGRVEPDPGTVIASGEDEEPAGAARKLIATIGDQLARYGPRAPQLWLPPLDEPIPLSAVLARVGVPPLATSRRWLLKPRAKPGAGLSMTAGITLQHIELTSMTRWLIPWPRSGHVWRARPGQCWRSLAMEPAVRWRLRWPTAMHPQSTPRPA